MAANTSPIFTLLGQVATDSGVTPTAGMSSGITLAAADYDGAGANNRLVFTADPTNGSFVSRLRCKAKGTNVASVLRVFLNNGGTPTTAANNSFIGEISLPATTAIATAATAEIDYPLGFALPPGFRIYVGLGTAVAAGWVVTCIGGDY
jgi:hypothetical protein